MKDACFYDRMSGFMNFKGAHLYFLFLNYMGYSQIWQKIIVWGIMMPFKILQDITIFIIFHLSASAAWFIYGCNLEIKVLPLWQRRYMFAPRGSCSLPSAKTRNVLIFVSDAEGKRQDWGAGRCHPGPREPGKKSPKPWDERGFQSPAAPVAPGGACAQFVRV